MGGPFTPKKMGGATYAGFLLCSLALLSISFHVTDTHTTTHTTDVRVRSCVYSIYACETHNTHEVGSLSHTHLAVSNDSVCRTLSIVSIFLFNLSYGNVESKLRIGIHLHVTVKIIRYSASVYIIRIVLQSHYF